ncbi:MAG: hypothetical protein WC342_09595 [Methanoregula sp.]|jgi:hypothetical protein
MTEQCRVSTKIWICAILAVIIIGGITAFAYTNSNKAVTETAQWGLKSTAAAMATEINASEVEEFAPGDELSPRYMAIVDKLRNMRSMNDDIINAYIIKVNTTDRSMTFVIDDLYPSDPAGSAKIGEADDSPDKALIFAALSGPTVSPHPYSDKFGSFVSAYAPIDDSANSSNGNTTAILGIDVDGQDFVNATTQGTWIIISGIISIIIALGAIFYFGRRAMAAEAARENK